MEGVAQLFPNKIEKGIASISKFSIDHNRSLMSMMSHNPRIDYVPEGDYVKLVINGTLYMSDTRMERTSNREFCDKANGSVMIAGLGIGLILHNIRESVRSGKVTKITIFEKYQDVIDMVAPYYQDLPITYVNADILEYKPAKGEVYDTIYFDIWPDINTDNLSEIRVLHNRWKNHLNKSNPECYMNSWMKGFLHQEKQKENRSYSGWFL